MDVYEEIAEAVAAHTALQWEAKDGVRLEDELRDEYDAVGTFSYLSAPWPHNHGNRNYWRPANPDEPWDAQLVRRPASLGPVTEFATFEDGRSLIWPEPCTTCKQTGWWVVSRDPLQIACLDHLQPARSTT